MAGGHKVRVLDNSFFREKNKAQKMHERKSRVRIVHRRRLIFIGIFVALTAFFCGYQIIHTHFLTANLEAQVKSARSKLDQEKQTRVNLKQQVKQLNDQDYLQKLIREKYYYSKDGETIYSLPSTKTNNAN
ncbi:FtsB family cell division protein [Liquorilactobacillus satsumensis]|uniref:Cell division protein DIVIC n=1 Tax=Liquorilactobacillus satsumensis DSM 16230 = JCM 12392 TaxID=1423801 RepID=A0A0R1V320_9LACO|nr:septum formation initiator family protein [Liquorilactobacillus satsumensis]KRM00026.1 hypothetical protein FD50_GL002265 [Liquorilactobacillus satsumensis DSM 16230 = JCM 12392]MCC7666985.1 cell division protein DIVIC [Liquorilactobacillus satsumensis]MCP9313603.1 septum formation initiator family protein [Liquorilactobacillus satsumensis]MCP9329716.1 septum formation initiator family protein [Liquorilactobacillus satsumensis]MCP9358601.1 septum formation initiator family protein [Liquoril